MARVMPRDVELRWLSLPFSCGNMRGLLVSVRPCACQSEWRVCLPRSRTEAKGALCHVGYVGFSESRKAFLLACGEIRSTPRPAQVRNARRQVQMQIPGQVRSARRQLEVENGGFGCLLAMGIDLPLLVLLFVPLRLLKLGETPRLHL